MNKRKIMSLIMAAMLVSNLSANTVFAENNEEYVEGNSALAENIEEIQYNEEKEVENKIFEYSNIKDVKGNAGENGDISSEVDNIKDLESGTIVMRFDNKSTTAFQTLLSFSNNTADRERVYVFIEGKKLGIERQSSDGTYKHVSRELTFNSGINTVAFKVEKNIGYSIFLNGEKVLMVESTTTKFIKGILGINSVNIGLSDRLSYNENPFTGDIDFVSLYSNVISDDELIRITSETVGNPSAQAAKINSVTMLDSKANYNAGDELGINIEFDQAVSLIGNRNITLVIGETDVPLVFTKQEDIRNFKFTGTIPEGIESGIYDIEIKAMNDLDVVNVNAKLIDLSSNINTNTKIIIGDDAISKDSLKVVIDNCSQLEKEEYSDESWGNLTQSLANANEIFNKEDASLMEIYEAKKSLEMAINSLERVVLFNLKSESSVKATETIDIKLSIDNIEETKKVQALDTTFSYDKDKFELPENGITAIDGNKTYVKFEEETPGTVRIIIGSLGAEVVSESDIVNIKLKAKSSVGVGDINISGKYSDGKNITDIKTKGIKIEVIENESAINKEELQTLINECDQLQEDVYTVESWVLFEQVLNEAKVVLENSEATQNQVDLVLGKLQVAKDGLQVKEETTEVFKKQLEITVDVAQGITDFTDVVPAVKAEFDAALTEAIEILANENATQEQVDKSFDRLSKAIQMLEFKGNKEQLNKLLSQIAELDSKAYTKESWDALQAVINREDIQTVINDENALQADIEKVYKDIYEAFLGLIEAAAEVNKDRLNELIEKVSKLDGNEYLSDSWLNFANALDIANRVSANIDATQEEVDEAYNSLLRAYLNLRLKPNKDKLNDLINKAEKLDATKYTEKSYSEVEKALNRARTVYSDDKASEADVLKAEKALEVAMANLVDADKENDNGDDNNGGSTGTNGNNGSGTSSGNTNNSGKLPQTGGVSTAAVGLIGTLTTALGFVLSKKKKIK